ncbi:MAG: exodeoxyribonuclease VII large subunit [Planctomycetes bacterium]|nr:exodeoxyribonuclease VII large subunit [Planctomycetota bacterium]
MSLFDAPAPGPLDPSAESAGPRVLGVRELTRAIKSNLEGLGRLAVEGEITQVKRAAAGHVYFDLKDIDAKISCAIWRSALPTAVRFDLKEGAKVIAHGRLDVYAPRGTYSLIVQRLEQRGIGDLLAKLEALKAELKVRGWFERRRPLPTLPRVIGLVTSRDTAALQDFLRTRSLRWPLYPVRFVHTSVQGPVAAAEIAAAIRRIDASGVDLIVLARGGGSLEDLWCFNELAVAEALWNTSVPVVTGVGHETDTTLADLVADHRAHTPTDAAQTVIPEKRALEAELERLGGYLGTALEGTLEARATRLEHATRALRFRAGALLDRPAARMAALATRVERQHPRARLEALSARLARVGVRLRVAAEAPRSRAEKRMERASATLEATSPFRVLERGYSITRRPDGTLVRRASEVTPGEGIESVLHEGLLVSRVEAAREKGS